MTKHWLILLVILGVAVPVIGCSFAGGSSSWVPSAAGPQAECERSGGVWRAALNFCERAR